MEGCLTKGRKIIYERDKFMWQNYLNGILGLWVILASYLYVPSGGGRVVTLITGLVIAIVGFWGGASDSDMEQNQHQMQH